jgi:hypothetical protein
MQGELSGRELAMKWVHPGRNVWGWVTDDGTALSTVVKMGPHLPDLPIRYMVEDDDTSYPTLGTAQAAAKVAAQRKVQQAGG